MGYFLIRSGNLFGCSLWPFPISPLDNSQTHFQILFEKTTREKSENAIIIHFLFSEQDLFPN